jgi:hypothetical protein
MVLVFRNDRVRARRRPEAWFAGRHGGLTDKIFAFIEIGMLLGDADDDFRRTGHAIAVPIASRRRRRHGGGGGRNFGATGKEYHGGQSQEGSDNGDAMHEDAHRNVSGSPFNSKDLASPRHRVSAIYEK